jgi:hypothetical protein
MLNCTVAPMDIPRLVLRLDCIMKVKTFEGNGTCLQYTYSREVIQIIQIKTTSSPMIILA